MSNRPLRHEKPIPDDCTCDKVVVLICHRSGYKKNQVAYKYPVPLTKGALRRRVFIENKNWSLDSYYLFKDVVHTDKDCPYFNIHQMGSGKNERN